MIIDTHVHLDDNRYDEDLKEVLQKAKDSGVSSFVIPGADPKTLKKAIEICEKYENVYFSVGVHPYDLDSFDEDVLIKYINHEKCVGVGECGLDYYRLEGSEDERNEQKQKQKYIFVKQIQIAKKYNKPLIVHIRDASDDSKKVLLDNDAQKVGGVLHCYNADEQLLSLVNQGFYFGIGGVVTFKNAKKLINVLPKIPLEKIVIETDGPYLTPEPYRGTRNEPAYTKYVIEKIANILGKDSEFIQDITTKNSKKLFLNKI